MDNIIYDEDKTIQIFKCKDGTFRGEWHGNIATDQDTPKEVIAILALARLQDLGELPEQIVINKGVEVTTPEEIFDGIFQF